MRVGAGAVRAHPKAPGSAAASPLGAWAPGGQHRPDRGRAHRSDHLGDTARPSSESSDRLAWTSSWSSQAATGRPNMVSAHSAHTVMPPAGAAETAGRSRSPASSWLHPACHRHDHLQHPGQVPMSSASVPGSVTDGGNRGSHPYQGRPAVILAVIPPGTTRKTGGDQVDGAANLTSENDTRCYPTDGAEPTHNRSVAGSRPASPT